MVYSNSLLWIVPASIVTGIVTLVVVGGLLKKYLFTKSVQVFLQGRNVSLPLRLVDKEVITHDTVLFTFGLPSCEHVLGLPAGNCVRFSARINGEEVRRAYTPLFVDDQKGYVKFLIKIYRKDVHPNFPAGGKMTQYLESLAVGDFVQVSGPFGAIHYAGDGQFEIKGASVRKLTATKLNMICGGTGLTPMYQIIKYIFNSCSDKTKVSVIFANASEKDIPLKDELDEICRQHPAQFRIWYTIATPTEHWTYSVGYVDQKMVEEHCYPASDTTVNLVCGPPLMVKNAVIPSLTALNHKVDSNLVF